MLESLGRFDGLRRIVADAPLKNEEAKEAADADHLSPDGGDREARPLESDKIAEKCPAVLASRKWLRSRR
jgi:hypothetical protein